jgi:hypothetical protein
MINTIHSASMFLKRIHDCFDSIHAPMAVMRKIWSLVMVPEAKVRTGFAKDIQQGALLTKTALIPALQLSMQLCATSIILIPTALRTKICII